MIQVDKEALFHTACQTYLRSHKETNDFPESMRAVIDALFPQPTEIKMDVPAIVADSSPARILPWPDPTTEMLNVDPHFDAVWSVIKSWDVNVAGVYNGYMGATGNHVRAILDALAAVSRT
jgi:hypothetical protein